MFSIASNSKNKALAKATKVSGRDKADAERWRYTQLEGYFSVRDIDGVSVGVLKYKPSNSYSGREQLSLAQCIEGSGKTIKEAVDQARRKRKAKGEKL